jgi:hypothetical protein
MPVPSSLCMKVLTTAPYLFPTGTYQRDHARAGAAA